jgi:hypothetical protein
MGITHAELSVQEGVGGEMNVSDGSMLDLESKRLKIHNDNEEKIVFDQVEQYCM